MVGGGGGARVRAPRGQGSALTCLPTHTSCLWESFTHPQSSQGYKDKIKQLLQWAQLAGRAVLSVLMLVATFLSSP